MPAEEEGPVHEVLIKCEEVVKEETVETENERRKWEETQYFASLLGLVYSAANS